MEYHVKWEIDVEAGSHKEAAEMALNTQRNQKSSAIVFNVTTRDGDARQIDLTQPDLVEHTFMTEERARGFAEGIEHVNDGAITDVQVKRRNTGRTVEWIVTYLDEDAGE